MPGHTLRPQEDVVTGKAVPQHTYGGVGEERIYNSYSFTTSELDKGEWSVSRPGSALPPEKGPPVPIVQEAGWASEPVRTQTLEKKIFLPLPGIDPRSPGRPVRSQTLLTELPRLLDMEISIQNKTFTYV
jgi:hypothetical protein